MPNCCGRRWFARHYFKTCLNCYCRRQSLARDRNPQSNYSGVLGVGAHPPKQQKQYEKTEWKILCFRRMGSISYFVGGGRAGTSSFWYVRGHPCVFYAQRPTCNVIPAGVRGQKVCLICGEGRRIAHARPYTLEKIDRTCNLFE